MKIFFDEIYIKSPERKYEINKIFYNHIDGIWSFNSAEFQVIKYQIKKDLGILFVIFDKFF